MRACWRRVYWQQIEIAKLSGLNDDFFFDMVQNIVGNVENPG